MTRASDRRVRRLRAIATTLAVALAGLWALGHTEAPAARRAVAVDPLVRTKLAPAPELAAPLSYSDEFERAELVEEMLKECRGVAVNAYELAQTSGEQLRLPAPIQLVTIRVRHPYCGEVLRTYARKTAV